jgi:hypothetical protein
MAWSLVCPANRGIGFHLTRHLLQTTKIPVVATTRKDIEGVKKSILDDIPEVDKDRLTVLEVDLTSTSLPPPSDPEIQTNPSKMNPPSPKQQKPPNHCSHHPAITSASPSLFQEFSIQRNPPPNSTTSS